MAIENFESVGSSRDLTGMMEAEAEFSCSDKQLLHDCDMMSSTIGKNTPVVLRSRCNIFLSFDKSS